MQQKGANNAENVKTKQARVGTVYQSQDWQKELQRSVSQVFATMQTELSCDRDFLPKICSDLGPEKRPGFTRKQGKRGPYVATQPNIKTPLRTQETGRNHP